MTEQRGGRSKADVLAPVRGVGPVGPDVRAHDFRRQEHRAAALDHLAFESVIAVRRPDAIGVPEDAHVGPCTA